MRNFLLAGLGIAIGAGAAFLPELAGAAGGITLPDADKLGFQNAGINTGTAGGTGGAGGVAAIVWTVIRFAQVLLGGTAVITIISAGLRMIFQSDDSGVVTSSRNHILYGILGLVLVLLSEPVVAQFYGSGGTTMLAGTGAIAGIGQNLKTAVLENIMEFVKNVLVAAAILSLTISGARMVLAVNAETAKKQRLNILYSLIGLVVVVLAQGIVDGFYTPGTTVAPGPGVSAPGAESSILTDAGRRAATAAIVLQIAGATRYFLAAVAVVIIFIDGFALLFRGDDGQVAEKRRRIMFAAVGLAVVLVATSFVKMFYAPTLDEATGVLAISSETLVDGSAIAATAEAARTSGDILAEEIFGIVKFLSQLATAFAVVAIVWGAIRLVLGGDEKTSAHKIVLGAGAGLLLVTLANSIVGVIFGRQLAAGTSGAVGVSDFADAAARQTAALGELETWTNFALGFLATAAIAVVVFAGYQFFVGGDEKGKKLLTEAVIGLLLIILSYGIVATFFPGAAGGTGVPTSFLPAAAGTLIS